MLAAWVLLAWCQANDGFPLQEGARWTYAQDGVEAMILDAVESSTTGREKTITVRVRGGSFFWHTEAVHLSVDERGLLDHGYTFQDVVQANESPYLVLPPTLEKGKTWTGSPKGRFTAEVMGSESVTVPAGTFTCWKIEYVLRGHFGTEHDFRAWLAPGTGFVRLEYWQISERGAKTALEKPYVRELVRFDRTRRAEPVPFPGLSDDDRKTAERLLTGLAEAEEPAATELVKLGRGAIPLLRERREAGSPELRSRLDKVLQRFPKLQFEVRLTRAKGNVGQPLPVRFALRNLTSETLDIVPALDNSHELRSPRYIVVVRDGNGTAQKPKEDIICGFVNPLAKNDFIPLLPGEEVDPLGPGAFRHPMQSWTPDRPGTYTVEAVYDATGNVPQAWKGSVSVMDPDVRKRLEAMHRSRYESNRLTIVVEP